MNKIFVTIGGVDGVGKTSLVEGMSSAGYSILPRRIGNKSRVAKENGANIGDAYIEEINDIQNLIRDNNGSLVADRYIADQVASNILHDTKSTKFYHTITPDVAILLTADIDIRKRRMGDRNELSSNDKKSLRDDAQDLYIKTHKMLYPATRLVIIDTTNLNIEEVFSRIQESIKNVISKQGTVKSEFVDVYNSGYKRFHILEKNNNRKLIDTYLEDGGLLNDSIDLHESGKISESTDLIKKLESDLSPILKSMFDFNNLEKGYDLYKSIINMVYFNYIKDLNNYIVTLSNNSATSTSGAEYHLGERKQPDFSKKSIMIKLDGTKVVDHPYDKKYLFENWNIDLFSQMKDNLIYVDGELGEYNKNCDINVYNMLIKIPGEDSVVLPAELVHLQNAIKVMCQHALSMINKNKLENENYVDNFKFYLTLDQKVLEPGEQHRGPNPHTDDIQGPRFNNDKSTVGFEYILSDDVPTVFYKKPVDLSKYNENTDDLWYGIENGVDENTLYKVETNKIGLMNFYQVHRGDYTNKKVKRTFLKLCVTEKLFDANSDTTNPHLFGKIINEIRYPWNTLKRKTPGFVKFVVKDRFKKDEKN